MANLDCGKLYLVKDNSESIISLELNRTYTIGTHNSNIRLKVESEVPECNILRTNSEGHTEFISDIVSRCLLNKKPFNGRKILIPGDVITLYDKKFIYEHPSMSKEAIELIQRENRKSYCNEKLNEAMVKKRRTTLYQQVRKNSISLKGSKTPVPRSTFRLNIPNRSTASCHKKNYTNVLEFHQDNIEIEDSSKSSTSSKYDKATTPNKNYSNDQPPDLIPICASPFTWKVTSFTRNTTMLNDISDPFSKGTPDTSGELSYNGSPHRTTTDNSNLFEKIPKSLSNVNSKISVGGISKTPKSILKTRKCSQTPINVFAEDYFERSTSSVSIENDDVNEASSFRATTPRLSRRSMHDSKIVAETPVFVRITRNSASTTPNLMKLRSSSVPRKSILKTPTTGKKSLNKSTKSPCYNISDKIPYVNLRRRSASECRRSLECSEIEAKPKKISATRRHSEFIRKPVKSIDKSNRIQRVDHSVLDLPSSLYSDEKTPFSLPILTNSSFITERRSQKRNYTSSYTNNPNLVVPSIADESDSEYSMGNSSEHYDSDREIKQEEEYSNVSGINSFDLSTIASSMNSDSSKRSKSTSEISLSDEGKILDIPQYFSPECTTQSTQARNPKRHQSLISDFTGRKNKMRRLSLTHDLTDMKGIKELLDISPKKSIVSLSELTDYEAIQDLLQESPTDKNSANADLSDVREVERVFRTPELRRSPRKKIDIKLSITPKVTKSSDINGLNRFIDTPRPQKLTDVSGVTEWLVQNSLEDDLTDTARGYKKLHASPKSEKSLEYGLSDVEDVRDTLAMPKTHVQRENDLSDREVKKLLATPKRQKAPNNDLSDVRGVKKILATPKIQKQPKNDLTDVKGLKKLMATPKLQKAPNNDLSDVKGVKKILATPKIQKQPKNDLTDVKGLKKLMATPKLQKAPNNDLSDIRGVKKMLATPKIQKEPENDLSDVRGLKQVLATPKRQKAPNNDLSDVRGVKRMLATPKIQKQPKNDLTDVKGLKKLMATPKLQKPPKNNLSDVRGVKQMMATPKIQKEPENDLSNVSGVKRLMTSPKYQKLPKDDLSDVSGVKKLLKTPKVQRSPKNDLSNIIGVKKLMATPKIYNSPRNDLSDVRGVKGLMATPKRRKSPKNDLTNVAGMKRLLTTPKVQNLPKNDLSDVRGIKKLMTIPKPQKSPKDDLSNVHGVKDLFKMLENRSENDGISYEGLKELFQNDENDDGRDAFDKLIDRKSVRTYKSKGLSPKDSEHNISKHETSPLLLEWLEGQNKRVLNIESKKSTRSTKRKICYEESDNEKPTVEEVKRPVRSTRRKKIQIEDVNDEESDVISLRSTRSTRRNKTDDSQSNAKLQEQETDVKPTRLRGRPKQKRDTKTSDTTEDGEENNSKSRRRIKVNVKTVEETGESPANKSDQEKPPTKKLGTIKKQDNKASDTTEDGAEIKHKSRRKITVKDDALEERDSESSNHSLYTPNKSDQEKSPRKKVATRKKTQKVAPKIKEVTTPKKRGRPARKTAETSLDVSLSSLMAKSVTKRRLYNPDSYVETDPAGTSENRLEKNPAEEEEISEEGSSKSLRTKSQRRVNLPKMLEMFEMNLNRKSTDNNKKSTRKRDRSKSDVQEPEPRVTRSRRLKK